MGRRTAVLLVLAAAAGTWAQGSPAPPAADTDVVRYVIDVRLDPATHRLSGSETIRWRNATSRPAGELRFHLYLNAFASPKTTFMRELGGRELRGAGRVRSWGWTRITALRLADGTDLLPSLEFVRPDDGNPEDRTVARVPLPEPVAPGGTVELELSFEALLPRVVARTGWAGDFHLAGQWFPKLGVFTEDGWNCHQFHANSEFFADFGSYEVTVTVPEGWVVGATGVEAAREPVAEGTDRAERVRFRAERVHDFAWCAAPADLMDVVEEEFAPSRDVPRRWLEETARLLGVSTAELDLPPVHLRLLIPHDQRRLAARMLRAARLGIAWYGLHYGPYPYPQLTIVSPPVTAREAGGMEYPTFITTGASRFMEYPPFAWLPLIETVTIHEFGHQYFYGLLASNEFEAAWLDEGLNTYAEASCTAAAIRDHLVPELEHWPQEPLLSYRMSLLGSRFPITIDTFSWRFRTRRDYFTASYQKTAVALATLERLLGADRFARAMRAYALAWRFRHPAPADFRAALEASLGEDLGWYFGQVFSGDADPDWAVLAVRQRRVPAPAGFAWRDGEWVAAAEGETAKERRPWRVRVDVGRRTDFVGPVEIELVWEDGSRERRTWDGRDRWTRIELESPRRLDQVVVDPDGVWALEVRRADNYWRREPARGAAHRALWWTGELLRAAAALVALWS